MTTNLVTPEKPRLLVPGGAETPFDSGPVVVTPKPGRLGLYSYPERPEIGREDWARLDDWRGARAADIRRRLPLIGGGAAGTWTFTNATRTNLLNGTHDLDSDTHKMALFLSTSNIGAGSTTFAGLTNEHSAANGYTAGGIAITLTLSGTTTVTVDISTDPVWTASGGNIVARFAVIYEVSGNVICYCLLDSTPADVTATDGNTLTVAAHASGVFTLA